MASLPRIGFPFRLEASDARPIAFALLAYATIALPFGLGLGFLSFAVDERTVAVALALVLAIYFLNALPEELLFRGVIQSQLEGRFADAGKSLAVTAVIFGLCHANNPTMLHPSLPNWPYVLMASLAGIAYGWTWFKTRKITASAIVHGAVNLIWLSFLNGAG